MRSDEINTCNQRSSYENDEADYDDLEHLVQFVHQLNFVACKVEISGLEQKKPVHEDEDATYYSVYADK